MQRTSLQCPSLDPKPPSIELKFRSAKALFVPSLKRDIVPSIACTRPPAGGSHGNPPPTARIHIHTGRRGGGVAARGASAAGGDAGDRISWIWLVRFVRAVSSGIPQRSRRNRLCRRAERRDRVSLGGGPIIPIVFVLVSDPVGEGFVASLSNPGSNITGFIHTEGEIAGKLLELLKEIAPGVKRVTIIFNPETAPGRGAYYLPSFERAARSFGLEPIPAPAHNDAEVEAIVEALGPDRDGGLVAMPDGFTLVHRTPIILQAARNKVPAVYWNSIMARDGGLLSYGPDTGDIFRRAALYVDRILRGAKPAELPVQLPTKFQMAVNLKTAKELGLTIPEAFLLRADEVIE